MTSLRRTLAVRFSLTMLIALAAVGCWIYFGMQRTLEEQFDRSLQRIGQQQSTVITALGAPTPAGTASPQQLLAEGERLVVLRDSTGRVLSLNTRLEADLPLDRKGFLRARGGETAFATGRWRGTAVRSGFFPVRLGDTISSAVLQVAGSAGPLESLERSMRLRLLATALLGGLVTMVGAGWLAGASVAPVAEIAAQARAISGGAPSQRMTVHAGVAEFSELTSVLNEMLARLDRARAWPRQIIRDLGHDLRTPITVIRAEAEVSLSSERTSARYQQALANILEEVDRLTLISDALVLLGRLESGGLVPALEDVDAGALLQEAVAQVKRHQAPHVISATANGHPLVQADRQLLASALDQLLDNAVRYTPPGSRIAASASAVGDGVELVVEDNGPGVPPEVLPHLFERFYRADAARGRAAGPGLGLTVVGAIVELHGGTVKAEPAAAGGLCIRIRLPLHQSAAGPA